MKIPRSSPSRSTTTTDARRFSIIWRMAAWTVVSGEHLMGSFGARILTVSLRRALSSSWKSASSDSE